MVSLDTVKLICTLGAMLDALKLCGNGGAKDMIAHFGAKVLVCEGRELLSVVLVSGGDFAVVYDPDMVVWAVAQKIPSGAWELCDFLTADVMKVLCLLPADPLECPDVQKFIQT